MIKQKKMSVICMMIITCSICASVQDKKWCASAEFLYWSFKKNDCSIPFVTHASLSDSLPGALGQPGTTIALSSKNLAERYQIGGRFLLGGMLNREKKIEGELTYLFLPNHEQQHCLTTTGQRNSQNLAVPVFDTTGVWGLNGIPGNTIALLPGPLFGEPGFSAQFNLCGRSNLQELEVHALFTMDDQDCTLLQTSLGFGWLQFNESIRFNGTSATVGDLPPDFFNFTDSWATHNNFFGALFGAREKTGQGATVIEVRATGGIGAMINHYCIEGSSQTEAGNLFFLTKNTSNDELCGGIFTQPSNIGKRTQLNCAGIFEAIIRGSYYPCNSIELSLGYNFMLLSHVARAIDQIDGKINSTRTSLAALSRETLGTGPGPIPFGKPGSAPAAAGDCSPMPFFKTRTFWTQGLIAGIKTQF